MILDKAISVLRSYENNSTNVSIASKFDTRALLIVTLVYLFCMLSLPITKPERIIWFAVYPIILSPMVNISYGKILYRSCFFLPFVALIGIFNPIFDKKIAFIIGGMAISEGWITFFSIIIRGLLAVQSLLLLVQGSGFINICNSLKKIGLPKVLCVQLMFLYRFIFVLIEETITIQQAIKSRGYGKNSLPIKLWAPVVGNLLLRSVKISKNIYNSMLARGYNGNISYSVESEWTLKDFAYIALWSVFFLVLRFCDPTVIFN